jgi:hypothetical protein
MTKKSHRTRRPSRASRLRAASSVALPRQIVIAKPAVKNTTRRERLMIVALIAVVAVDVLRWVAPLFR